MNKVILALLVSVFGSVIAVAQHQQDTIPPVLTCKTLVQNNFYVNNNCIPPAISAFDLIDTLYDDQGAGALLEVGIRKKCTGIGFPEYSTISTYYAEVFHPRAVEIWARDEAGNIAYCETAFKIFDASGFCDPSTSLAAETAWKTALPGVIGHFSVFQCGGDTVTMASWPTVAYPNAPEVAYWSNFGYFTGTPGDSTVVYFEKNTNPLNGVSTADLVEIQKHILGLKPFTSPYQHLAADVNLDGQVTTYDVVLIQKLILGVLTEFPRGRSWRLVPKQYQFSSLNPISPVPPDQLMFERTVEVRANHFDLVGVKLGDVNFSADPTQ